MDSSLSRTDISKPPVHPIERLNWEHARLLGEVDRLEQFVEGQKADIEGIGGRAMELTEALEHHQEAEERFLFPLVSGLGEELFAGLREEHLRLVQATDELSSLARLGQTESTAGLLLLFKKNLRSHFTREEEEVLSKAAGLLSPAQLDILKIKFASRKALER